MVKTKIAIVAMMIVIFALISASIYAKNPDVKIYFGISYMDWTERDYSPTPSTPFVEESGPIFSIGVDVTFRFKEFFEEFTTENFGGLLWYKSNYILTGQPCDIYVDRMGIDTEETTGYRMNIYKDFNFSPFVSFGFSPLWRDETEIWLFCYGKLGAILEKGDFFVKIGVLIPFFTEDDCFWAGIPWLNNGRLTRIVAYPKGVIMPFAEVGFRFKKFDFSFFYDPREWERSDNVNLKNGWYAYQPETEKNSIGFKVGYHF